MRRILVAVLLGGGIVTAPLHAEPSPSQQPDQVVVNSQVLDVMSVRWHRHGHRRRHFHRLVLLPFASPPLFQIPRQDASGAGDAPWVDPDERAP